MNEFLTKVRTSSGDDVLDQLQADAAPDTVTRIAALVAAYDGSNAVEVATAICSMIFEGESLDDPQ
jgi:hypothetical protein